MNGSHGDNDREFSKISKACSYAFSHQGLKAMPEPIITVEGLSKLPRSHNDEQATKRYFATALNFLAESAVMVFDDINWSEGMKRA